ncbi:MAG: ankyrin repeat domain-containing protein [Candidatus Margulisbacteria bacterium]|nr:ankyrin repeat domain-containing protein [Candidatus Margulisiibacteriota bacterium]
MQKHKIIADIIKSKIPGIIQTAFRELAEGINIFESDDGWKILEEFLKLDPADNNKMLRVLLSEIKITGNANDLSFLAKNSRPEAKKLRKSDEQQSARISIWNCITRLSQSNKDAVLKNLIRDLEKLGFTRKSLYTIKKPGFLSNELINAVHKYSFAIIKLLQAGADVNGQSRFDKNYAITSAARLGHTDVVIELLKTRDIDVNVQDFENMTALIWASLNGNIEIVKELLKNKKIDVNIKARGNRTALIWASHWGRTEIVKKLLEIKNTNINVQDEDGYTALLHACRHRRMEIAKKLLKFKNIDIHAKSKDYNKNALKMARENNMKEVEAILLKLGAQE